MTTLRNEIIVNVTVEKAWNRLKDVRATHELFAGVLLDSRFDGEIRTVKFANGMEINERIVAIDDDMQRIAYAVIGDQFVEHAASMQIAPVNSQQCRFIWISDFLPDTKAEMVGSLMEQGCAALKRALEAS